MGHNTKEVYNMNIQNMINVMSVSNHGKFTACNHRYLIGIFPKGHSLEIAPVFMNDSINRNEELYDFHLEIDCEGGISLCTWDDEVYGYVRSRRLNATDHPSSFVAVCSHDWGAEYFPAEAEEMKQYILDLATEWKRVQEKYDLCYWQGYGFSDLLPIYPADHLRKEILKIVQVPVT
jgi:hypothetical protein